ncbi:uncharacterized protein LOC103023603 isoform X1 [Astyanax mexicanus]|uniref:uncharacterized protein LOC103023603 isoform X1 n=1 Tax=Astyanax mexicanus TaxID=7994 RepID=UPI0020CAEB15|nr:uncharacterized protein LOC103023603 isoform X1 [Astyanax mexicanus]
MLSSNKMDLPGDGGQLLSDCQVTDVETLVQEEFHKQIFGENAALGLTQTSVSNTDLWDSLWKPIDQSSQPAANPVLFPVANPVVASVDDAFIHPEVNPIGKPIEIPDVDPVVNPMVNPVFCLACDTMFISRQFLENHICPFVNFICSCGISFTKYPEMWSHSTSHNHKATYVINHKSAIQSRITSVKEQEWKLKVLEQTAKKVGIAQNVAPVNPAQPPPARYIAGKTINLWKKFRPVVKVRTNERFGNNKNYRCAVCRLETCTRDVLIQHVNAVHNSACIYGCSRCGMLLIGRVPPKVLHRCGPVHITPRERYTFGQLLRDPLSSESLYMPYACQFCSLRFGHQVHLSNHLRFNHSNVTKAPQPPKITALPSIKKGVQRPAIARPAIARPAIARPAIARPAIARPAIARPAIARPNVARPSIARPAIARPNVARPAIARPAVSRPTVAQPSIARPTVAQPAIAQPAVVQPAVAHQVPSGTSQASTKMRCAVCKRMIDSFEMLEQHWCEWTLTLMNPKTIERMGSITDQPQSMDSSLSSETSSSDASVHSTDTNNVKTYGHTKLLTIKTEPVEVNVTMTQTDVSHKTVKPEPELIDHDNGAGKSPAEIKGLFYQKCSASNTNNLKYLFSNI